MSAPFTLEKIFNLKKGSKEKIEIRGKITSDIAENSFYFTDINKANCLVRIKKKQLILKSEEFPCGKYIKLVNPIVSDDKNGLELIESSLMLPTTKIKNLEDIERTEINTTVAEDTDPTPLKEIKEMDPDTVSIYSFKKTVLSNSSKIVTFNE